MKWQNIIQISNKKNSKVTIYSSEMEKVLTMKSASIQNENNFVQIYNEKEKAFLDKDGNKIEETSEIVQQDLNKKLPQQIGKYKKQQITLDDVYYEITKK